jgi:hypothetical protein
MKCGRPWRMKEARQRAALANTGARQEATVTIAPRNDGRLRAGESLWVDRAAHHFPPQYQPNRVKESTACHL